MTLEETTKKLELSYKRLKFFFDNHKDSRTIGLCYALDDLRESITELRELSKK